MLDRQIVAEKVRDKMLDMTFSAIVESCFIQALPFDKDATRPYVRDLMTYTDTVLESLIMNGHKVDSKFEVLLNAIESETNPQKSYLLNKIASTCITTAMEVSNRVSKDDDLLENSSMDDILESVGLDEDERDEFNKNVSDLDTDKLAEVIQDKVVKTIKTEKEEEEKAIALEDKLKDAISPEDADATDDDLGDDNPDGEDDLDENLDDNLDDGNDDLGDADDSSNTGDTLDGEEDDGLDDKGMPIEDEPAAEPEGTDVNVDNQSTDKDKKTGNGDDINININIEQDKSKEKSKAAKESMTAADKAFNNFCNVRLSPFHAKAPISFLSRLTDCAVEAVMRTEDGDNEIPMSAVYKVTFSPMMEFFDKKNTYNDIIQEASIQRDKALEASALGDKPMIVSIIVYTVMETLKTLNLFSPTTDQIKKIVGTPTDTSGVGADKMAIAREEVKKKTDKISGEIESAVNYTDIFDAEMAIESLRGDLEVLKHNGVATESISNALDNLQFKAGEKKKVVLKDDAPLLSYEVKKVATEAAFGIDKINKLYANHPRVSFITMELNTAQESCNPKVLLRASNGDVICQTFIDLNNHNLKDDALMKAITMGIESATKVSSKPLKVTDYGQNGKTYNFTI